MDCVSPVGPVYQAGTLSGNPLAMAAGLVMVKHLRDNPQVYSAVNESASAIVEGIRKQLFTKGLNYTVNQVGSMFTLFFTGTTVVDFATAMTSDVLLFARYFQSMLKEGIYMAPSQYEAMFISEAVDKAIVDRILNASEKALSTL